MSFDELGLRAELINAVKTKGYTLPTPIQTLAIPVILNGRDLLARAQTGTGKTDAFALPLVEILSRQHGKLKFPRALVLAPTRELALQIGEVIKAYARRASMRCTVVHGGAKIQPQVDRIKRGIDILVATPGRLLDLSNQNLINLSYIEILVFDEADRMLDLGFSEEISAILDFIPKKRRTMLFSATYTQQIRNLASIMLTDPEHIEVTPQNTAAESVLQKVHLVNQLNKRDLLIHLITKGNWSQVLIFSRTKHGANKLTGKLSEQGFQAVALHGNKSQSFRTRTLKEFKDGKIHILVATDLAARGLDICNLPYVINYDIPNVPEDYIHRIGRTGRAGEAGIAISLVSHQEKVHLKAIEKLLNHKIKVEKIDGYTEDSDVPDYVLFRPNNLASEKKADKEIKELVAKRNASKQKSKIPKTKTMISGKNPGSKSISKSISKLKSKSSSKSNSKSRPQIKKNTAGKKSPKSGSFTNKSSKQNKPKGRR